MRPRVTMAMVLASLQAGGCTSCHDSHSGLPATTQALMIDGELLEADWQKALRTGAFMDAQTHASARPYSEARVLRDTQNLYVALYAADENITDEDAFKLDFLDADQHTLYALQITAAALVHESGLASDPVASPKVALDMDGTINAPDDDDEEWVVETAIPWRRLGQSQGLQISRCDVPKDGERRCGSARIYWDKMSNE